MKAPDKLYLPIITSRLIKRQVLEYTSTDSVPSPFADENIEYIRKEAILEWVKDALDNVDGINFEEDNYEAGLAHAYGMVISKIESL